MKQSNFFTKIVKEIPKDEDSYNAQTLIRAGFIDKLSAGIYSYLPLGKKVIDKICQIIREEINKVGGQEISMPALSPKEVWQKTARWDNFDVLFKLSASDKKDYALGATHEEIVTPLVQKFVSSYKDLPVAVYQIQTKFRNEKRAKAGLMRGREFLMKDLYSFHADQADLDSYYEKVKQAYFNIYNRLGIGKNTYLTYASGGDFSKYSHEFQTLSPVGEDKIFICKNCQIAINQEIIEEQNICPECGKNNFKSETAIEVGNIFKLGNRFSRAFKFYYSSKEGEKKDIIMGCYGLGISRVLATIVENCHDQNGLIWPEAITPFSVHLISLGVDKEAQQLYDKLKEIGADVLYDNRDISAGIKFAEADLIACSLRIVISKKTLAKNLVEIKKRKGKEGKLISQLELFKLLK
jgi:prolyl-tRNA synthetase